MKITGLKAHILQPTEPIYRWRATMEARSMQFILLRILTDEGHEGHCMSWMMLTPGEVKDAFPDLRRRLVGRDPHEVGAISKELTFDLERPTRIASHIDVSLWDAVGKHHNEPLYKLFGAARTKLPAYADSVFFCADIDAHIAKAEECRRLGFLGIKIHPECIPDKDIELCRALRDAMGPDFALLIDTHNYYSRSDALRVGRVLEELGFIWFEAPILDSDVQGITALSQALDVPIAGAESVVQGIRTYPQYLTNNACPILRGIGDLIGGITGLRKAAATCEAFNVKFEAHSYGSPHITNAHLHVMFAMGNCDWIELPVPQDAYEVACRAGARVQPDGHVYAPQGPGLGCEVDWDELKRLTIEEV